MRISVSGSQSVQSHAMTNASLQTRREQLKSEIQKLPQEDTAKNQDRIKSQQSQLQQIKSEFLQREQSSNSENIAVADLVVGPAYIVQLGQPQTTGSIADSMLSSNVIGPAYQVEIRAKNA